MVDCCNVGKPIIWDRSEKSFVYPVRSEKEVPLIGVIGMPELVFFRIDIPVKYCFGCGKKIIPIPNIEIDCKHMEKNDSTFCESKMWCNNPKAKFRSTDEYYCMTCQLRESKILY